MGELMQQLMAGGPGVVPLATVRERFPDFWAAWDVLPDHFRAGALDHARQAFGDITPAWLAAAGHKADQSIFHLASEYRTLGDLHDRLWYGPATDGDREDAARELLSLAVEWRQPYGDLVRAAVCRHDPRGSALPEYPLWLTTQEAFAAIAP